MTPENVAYLAALVSVSEEVRSRCHLKYSVARSLSKSASTDTFAVDPHLNLPLTSSQVSGISNPQGVSHQHSGGASSPSNHISSPGLSFPTIGSFSSLVSVPKHDGKRGLVPILVGGGKELKILKSSLRSTAQHCTGRDLTLGGCMHLLSSLWEQL